MAIYESSAQVLLRFEFCTNVPNVICHRFKSNTHVGRTALNNNRSGIDEEKKQQPSNPVDTVRRHRHPSAISVCTEQRFREKLAGQVPLLKLCESPSTPIPRGRSTNEAVCNGKINRYNRDTRFLPSLSVDDGSATVLRKLWSDPTSPPVFRVRGYTRLWLKIGFPNESDRPHSS